MDVLAGHRPPFAAIWASLFNGQLIEWYPFTMVVTTYTPLSPTRTRLRSEYYFDPEIAATRRDYVECGLAVLDEVTGEDQAAAQRLQDGRPHYSNAARMHRARINCRWSKDCGDSTIVCVRIVENS